MLKEKDRISFEGQLIPLEKRTIPGQLPNEYYIMKMGKMPYHGAMVKVLLKGDKESNILLIGDTGAGKSESLEAFTTPVLSRTSDDGGDL